MSVSVKGGTSATTTGRILDRPYIGLWKPNFRKVLTYSPDALVYINGDTSLVGCKDCNNRIDFQPYITQVSCGAGVETSSGDANISFSIPKHHGDSIFKDGAFLITPGLEVNVYIRGVFDVKELNNEEIVQYPDGETYNLKDLKMKPYYPVFHGVVTSISYAYSGGFYNGSFACNNLLYFWQYQFIDTNTAAMAARPSESPGSVQMTGHKYTGMTPHQIIYDLFRDSGGSAQGVVAGINKKTNVNARVGNQDAFSLSLRYWERRFSQGMYGLRMHGASGRLFSSLEQVYYGRLGAGATNKIVSDTLNLVNKQQSKTSTPNATGGVEFARQRNFVRINGAGTQTALVERGPDVQTIQAQAENGKAETTADMQAFILDIGNLASINMWESTYETKQQIAQTVSEKVNFEFYQDVDGDLVFKPPLYNLNTKDSRVYVLKPEDIVSMNFSVKEPQYTYAVVKGVNFKNLNGVSDDEFITPKSTYIDYKLVAKYGWRPLQIDSNIHTNTTSAFYYAAAELDRQNQDSETASVTITLRPELKPGYPVYIEHIDCFYYVTSVSHDFTYGSSCSTTIEIKARRKRFMPPGDINTDYRTDPSKAVDLIDTHKGLKYLKKREEVLSSSGLEKETVLKVTGFPNVVMGLDMTRIDPNFWYMGTETLEIDKPHFKRMLIVEAMSLGVLKLASDTKDPFNESAQFIVIDTNNQNKEIGTISGADITTGQQEISEINSNYQKEIQKISAKKGKETSTEDKEILRNKAKAELQKQYNNLTKVDDIVQIQTPSDQQDVSFVYGDQLSEALLNPDPVASFVVNGGQPSLTLLDLINLVRINKERANEISTGMGSTANILELLSNKKNAFSPHVPGYFRYFSCSHPDPKMQGATEIEYSTEGGEIKSIGERLILTSDERFNGNKVNIVVPDTNGDGDTVTFIEGLPKAGLKVKNPFTKQLEVIATNEITSLTFQEHDVKVRVSKIDGKKKEEILIDIPPELLNTDKENEKKDFFDDYIKYNSKKNIKTTSLQDVANILISDITSILGDENVPNAVKDLVKDPEKLFKANSVVRDSTQTKASASSIAATKAIAIATEEFNKGLAFEWTQQAKYAWMSANGGADAVNKPDYSVLNAGNKYIDENYFKAIFGDFTVDKTWDELKSWHDSGRTTLLNNEWCGSLPAFCYKDLVIGGFDIKKFASTVKLNSISSPNKNDESTPLYQMEWLKGKNISKEDILAGDIVVVWDNKDENSKRTGNHITLCVEPPNGNTFNTIEGNRDTTPGGVYPPTKGTDNSLKNFTQGVLKHKREVTDIRFVYRIREKFLKAPPEEVQTATQNQTANNEVKTLIEYAAGNLWTAIETAFNAHYNAPQTKLEEKAPEAIKKAKENAKNIENTKKKIIPERTPKKVSPKVKQGEFSNKTKKSMVFPVSDEEGYEVYGFQAYGRGLNLKPNGGYMSLVQQDYTRLLNANQAENIYSILKKDKQDTEKRTEIKKEIEELASYFSSLSPTDRDVLLNTTGISLDQSQTGRDYSVEEAFLTGFANRILSEDETNKYKDTNSQVIAENIPRALNTLSPGGVKNSGSVCQCRGYDSDLDLEDLTEYNTPYVKLDFSGSEPDTFSQKLHDVMVEKGETWKEDQILYRGGDNINGAPLVSDIVGTISNALSKIETNVNTAEARVVAIAENYTTNLSSIEEKEKLALEKAAATDNGTATQVKGFLWKEDTK